MRNTTAIVSAVCMPSMAIITAGILFAAGASWADPGNTAASPTPAKVEPAAKPRNVCINAGDIDHLSYPDDKTILFHMRGKKIWRNDLKRECPGLKFEQAVSYEIRGGTICGNMQVVYVMRRWTPCMLGPFTPYTKPAADAPANPPKDGGATPAQ